MRKKIYTQEDFEKEVKKRVEEEIDQFYRERDRREEFKRLRERVYQLESRVEKLENPNKKEETNECCKCMPSSY